MSTTGLNERKRVIYKMIPANLDKTIQIKELDKTFIHVEYTRVTILPLDILHPIYFKFVNCHDVMTFETLFETNNERTNIDHLRATGCVEMRIVHDPRLTDEQAEKRIKKTK